ncbi:hypothetical protein SAMN04488505_1011240 [Chitinophaga rupis]|uniref:MORN repeat variant n=2 Tax=Chitinophaga rupis TaxID=573321 RepID=A0A1H7LFD1_9BACT|nr:hypothetical protein SAMN04488505_1011240 [Chitinophaga rupis]
MPMRIKYKTIHMLLKPILIATFFIYGATACQSQTHQTSQQTAAKNNDMQTTKNSIDDKFEKLDIAELQAKGSKSEGGVAKADGNMVAATSYDLTTTGDDGAIITISGNNVNGYTKKETSPDSYFEVNKEYYPDGNIKSKGLKFINGGFNKGTWYFFDEKGTLTKSTNFDAPYKFTLENVMQFLQSEHIPLAKGPAKPDQGMVTTIWRNEGAQGPIWKIQWLKDKTKMPNTVEEIVLDGNTGKVTKRVDQKYNNS